MKTLSEWDSIGCIPDEYERLPVDLTPSGRPSRPVCWSGDDYHNPLAGVWHAWVCTRPTGHTGRHAAGDGLRIRAVWR